MTIKELLIKEIDNTPSDLLEDLFSFLKTLKSPSQYPSASYQELLDRIDYLEAIVGIRKGLDEFAQGKGIPADRAFADLQQKLDIPPRP